MRQTLRFAFLAPLALAAGLLAAGAAGAETLGYPSAQHASFLIDYPAAWEMTPGEGPGDYVTLVGPTGVTLMLRTIPGTKASMEEAVKDSYTYLGENYTDLKLSDPTDSSKGPHRLLRHRLRQGFRRHLDGLRHGLVRGQRRGDRRDLVRRQRRRQSRNRRPPARSSSRSARPDLAGSGNLQKSPVLEDLETGLFRFGGDDQGADEAPGVDVSAKPTALKLAGLTLDQIDLIELNRSLRLSQALADHLEAGRVDRPR